MSKKSRTEATLYDFSATAILGEKAVEFKDYAGKVVVIQNVASL